MLSLPFGKVLIITMAVWRICSLLYDEEGPWGVCHWIRKKLGVEHDEDGKPIIYSTWLQPLQCFWCLTLIISICLLFIDPIAWLAASAGAIMIERWIGRSKSRLF